MNNELYHHGIIGQKWYVRRYQNEDGSLTAEGKKRLENYKKSQKDYQNKYYDKHIKRYDTKANDNYNKMKTAIEKGDKESALSFASQAAENGAKSFEMQFLKNKASQTVDSLSYYDMTKEQKQDRTNFLLSVGMIGFAGAGTAAGIAYSYPLMSVEFGLMGGMWAAGEIAKATTPGANEKIYSRLSFDDRVNAKAVSANSEKRLNDEYKRQINGK